MEKKLSRSLSLIRHSHSTFYILRQYLLLISFNRSFRALKLHACVSWLPYYAYTRSTLIYSLFLEPTDIFSNILSLFLLISNKLLIDLCIKKWFTYYKCCLYGTDPSFFYINCTSWIEWTFLQILIIYDRNLKKAVEIEWQFYNINVCYSIKYEDIVFLMVMNLRFDFSCLNLKVWEVILGLYECTTDILRFFIYLRLFFF